MRDNDGRKLDHKTLETIRVRAVGGRRRAADPAASRQGRLRECLVAGPGRALVAYDYSGIEFVTLAALTRDPGMLAVVNEGRDPHLAAAEVIWPGTAALPPGDERKRRRDQAKQFTHALGRSRGPVCAAGRDDALSSPLIAQAVAGDCRCTPQPTPRPDRAEAPLPSPSAWRG